MFFQDHESSDSEGSDQYSTGSENDAASWLQGTWDKDGRFHLSSTSNEEEDNDHATSHEDESSSSEYHSATSSYGAASTQTSSSGSSSSNRISSSEESSTTSSTTSVTTTPSAAAQRIRPTLLPNNTTDTTRDDDDEDEAETRPFVQLSIRWKPGEISESNQDDDLTPPERTSSVGTNSTLSSSSNSNSRTSSSASSSTTSRRSMSPFSDLWRPNRSNSKTNQQQQQQQQQENVVTTAAEDHHHQQQHLQSQTQELSTSTHSASRGIFFFGSRRSSRSSHDSSNPVSPDIPEREPAQTTPPSTTTPVDTLLPTSTKTTTATTTTTTPSPETPLSSVHQKSPSPTTANTTSLGDFSFALGPPAPSTTRATPGFLGSLGRVAPAITTTTTTGAAGRPMVVPRSLPSSANTTASASTVPTTPNPSAGANNKYRQPTRTRTPRSSNTANKNTRRLPTVSEHDGLHREDDGVHRSQEVFMNEPLSPKIRIRRLVARQRRDRRLFMIGVTLLIFVGIVAAVLVLLFLRPEDESTNAPVRPPQALSPSMPPTPAPTIRAGPPTPAPLSQAGETEASESPSAAPSSADEMDLPTWIEVGSPVPGQAVILSNDSRTMAVLDGSTVRIYHWVAADWQQLGQSIEVSSSAGIMVPFALSKDGRTIVVSRADRTQILRFQDDSSDWSLIGDLALPTNSLALARDGNVVTISTGISLQVFRFNPAEDEPWSLVSGAPVSSSGDRRSVATNADTSIVACSDLEGKVHVFRYSRNDSTWNTMGQELKQRANRGFGASLALSEVGLELAVGGTDEVEVLTFHTSDQTWKPLGGSIDTDNGSTVALSGDGNTLAVGGNGQAGVYEYRGIHGWMKILDASGGSGPIDVSLSRSGSSVGVSSGGQVAVLGHPDSPLLRTSNPTIPVNELVWSRLGNEVEAQVVNGELHPQSLALSGEGRLMALADPSKLRLLRLDSSNVWTPITNGPDVNDQVYAVSISKDGSTLAFAIRSSGEEASNNRSNGSVQVVQFDNNGGWRWLGQRIEVDTSPNSSIAISEEGGTLALGAPYYNANEGSVTVFQYNAVISWWLPQGQIITGDKQGDLCGTSVSLSSNGNTLAVGCPGNSNIQLNSGLVRVLRYEANGWAPLGQDALFGQLRKIHFGVSVDLSGSGTRLAVGAPGDFSGLVGQTHVFELEGNVWIPVGGIVSSDGTDPDLAGRAVALSSDGTTLAVGAPGGKAVWVLNQVNQQWQIIGVFDSDKEGFGSLVSVSIDGGVVAVGGAHNENSHFVRVMQQEASSTRRQQRQLLRSSSSSNSSNMQQQQP